MPDEAELRANGFVLNGQSVVGYMKTVDWGYKPNDVIAGVPVRDGAAWFTICKTKYRKQSKRRLPRGGGGGGGPLVGRDNDNETIWGERSG